jgi:hypothetical protein
MKENYKIIIAAVVIIVLIMIIVAAIICLPDMDHTVSGVYRSHDMNIFGGRRW